MDMTTRIAIDTFADRLRQMPAIEQLVWALEGDVCRFTIVADRLDGKQLEHLSNATIDVELQFPGILMDWDLVERRGHALSDYRPIYEGEEVIELS